MEGEPLSALCTPALVVDVDKVKKNAQRMIECCQKLGVQLRPHMKTHKTLECADIMTGGSRRCIVVSTLAEACFYADHGFDDILYAYSLPFDKVVPASRSRSITFEYKSGPWHNEEGGIRGSQGPGGNIGN